MSSNFPCDHARSLMSEAFSSELLISNHDLRTHLESCPSCKKEFEEILEALEGMEKIQIQNPVPSAGLWEKLEKQIIITEQEKPATSWFDLSSKHLFISQYSYITTLGVGLWLSLLYGQPIFHEVIQGFGLPSPEWLFSEYTLFVIFFSLGGFSAIIAAPILVHSGNGKGNNMNPGAWGNFLGRLRRGEMPEGSWMFRFYRLLYGNLRLFAC